ncbi:hypothetical protein BC828DRAFT_393249 [Blastocladiella britannica]|nr:hypothetical protein BC828DRAFT_393249 [Blastocladiella britannica]
MPEYFWPSSILSDAAIPTAHADEPKAQQQYQHQQQFQQHQYSQQFQLTPSSAAISNGNNPYYFHQQDPVLAWPQLSLGFCPSNPAPAAPNPFASSSPSAAFDLMAGAAAASATSSGSPTNGSATTGLFDFDLTTALATVDAFLQDAPQVLWRQSEQQAPVQDPAVPIDASPDSRRRTSLMMHQVPGLLPASTHSDGGSSVSSLPPSPSSPADAGISPGFLSISVPADGSPDPAASYMDHGHWSSMLRSPVDDGSVVVAEALATTSPTGPVAPLALSSHPAFQSPTYSLTSSAASSVSPASDPAWSPPGANAAAVAFPALDAWPSTVAAGQEHEHEHAVSSPIEPLAVSGGRHVQPALVPAPADMHPQTKSSNNHPVMIATATTKHKPAPTVPLELPYPAHLIPATAPIRRRYPAREVAAAPAAGKASTRARGRGPAKSLGAEDARHADPDDSMDDNHDHDHGGDSDEESAAASRTSSSSRRTRTARSPSVIEPTTLPAGLTRLERKRIANTLSARRARARRAATMEFLETRVATLETEQEVMIRTIAELRERLATHEGPRALM